MGKRSSKGLSILVVLALVVTTIFSSSVAVSAVDGTSKFADEFSKASNHVSKLSVRYWITAGWAGRDAAALAEIDREIKEIADAGYGTIELADVHDSMTQAEKNKLAAIDGSGSSYLYGSNNWLKAVEQVLKSAKAYGITVDMTFGQRWPASSNEIVPDDQDAAKELVYGFSTASALSGPVASLLPPRLVSTNKPYITDELLGVYKADYTAVHNVTVGGGGFMNPGKNITQFTIDDATLTAVSTPAGNINETLGADEVVIAVYKRGTGQTVSYQPSMDKLPSNTTDADAYVIDHFSTYGAVTMQKYYDKAFHDFNGGSIETLLKQVGGTWFEDSLELTTVGHWTKDMLAEFQRINGYDLTPYLPYVIYISRTAHADPAQGPFLAAGANGPKAAKIRDDFIETLSQMYAKNHAQLMNDWASSKWGMGFRVQAYGSTIDSALASQVVSNPEGESLTFGNQHDAFRVMASGRDMSADATGKILSTEVGANFAAGSAYGFAYADLLANFNKNYASGVNMAYLHGYSYAYSPDAEWPGYHAFGATIPGPFSSRMPEWTHINGITDYIARTQYVLQQGVQKSDFAIYQPSYNASEGAPYWTGTGLTASGYSYQFFTRSLFDLPTATVNGGVLNKSGAGYRAMVIPTSVRITKKIIDKLTTFAAAGLPILFVGTSPTDSYTFADDGIDIGVAITTLKTKANVYTVTNETTLIAKLKELGVTPAIENQSAYANLITIHRQDAAADYYYLFNDGAAETNVDVTLRGTGAPFLLDPWTGKMTPIVDYTIAANGQIALSLSIKNGDHAIVGITSGTQFGAQATNRALTATNPLRYENGKLIARVEENGDYYVKDTAGNSFIGTVRDLPAAKNLKAWSLKVIGWSKGDNAVTDVLDTKKTEVFAKEGVKLVAWRNLDGMPVNTSGLGTYTTTFLWDDAEIGAVLSFEGFNDTAKITINGQVTPAINLQTKKIDIGPWLKTGENTLVVEIASTLHNAARSANTQNYGIIGDVKLVPYKDVVLGEDQKNSVAITSAEIATIPDQTYDGTAKTPDLKATYNNKFLVKDVDYDVTWKNNVNAGVAVVTITGKGVYTGKTMETFTILPENVSKLTISTIKNQVYTGRAIAPNVVAKYGSNSLKADTHFAALYFGNTAIGKGTVKIMGMGNYTGARNVTFKILPSKIAVKKVATGKKQVRITWKKSSSAQKVTGYQIQYRVSKEAKWKTKTVSAKKISLTIGTLKKGKKYQLRVRAYKTVSGIKYYAPWSKVKTSGKVK